jgi:mono/diheme cytochrome c family protein
MGLERIRGIAAVAAFAAATTSCAGGPASGPAPCPIEGATARAEQLTFPPGLVDGNASRGEALFAAECARCHSHDVADRGSRLFRGYPRLDCGDWLAGASDVYLFRIISEGGEAMGKQALMKPFSDRLSGQEISNLVAYLRASKS